MTKYIIGLCDDEIIVLHLLKEIISNCLKNLCITAEIQLFQSGSELLNRASEIDIAFIDIEMPTMDGIETGTLLLKKNKHCKIIMATCRTDRFKEAFKIQAFRFVTKPFDTHEIQDALVSVYNTFIGLDGIELYENRIMHVIPQRDISYICAYDGYIEAMVSGKTFRKQMSLKVLESSLDSRLFYRISRQYSINMLYIQLYKNGKVIVDGKVIVIPRRNKKDFEKKYIEFDLNYR